MEQSNSLRYIDINGEVKILAHTWNNVVEWGQSSNKQPFSHLAIIDIPNLSMIFEKNKSDRLLPLYSSINSTESWTQLIQIMMVTKK